MTKVGEGNLPAKEPTETSYRQQLDRSATKFLDTLGKFNRSQSGDEQAHLRRLMDLQMGLIQSAVNELKEQGVRKEGEKVGKDYSDYMNQQTDDRYTRLQNDLETLRDYTKPH